MRSGNQISRLAIKSGNHISDIFKLLCGTLQFSFNLHSSKQLRDNFSYENKCFRDVSKHPLVTMKTMDTHPGDYTATDARTATLQDDSVRLQTPRFLQDEPQTSLQDCYDAIPNVYSPQAQQYHAAEEVPSETVPSGLFLNKDVWLLRNQCFSGYCGR
ncbi:hypothetical protein E5288_WYG005519 [Bos mutus]|uniref:Uncharacterized protein n=1 Tax=Bos mutus TaxID=72004 RepID=A0A6B0RLE8_9CETA|nr:hypothetical protein [Bos mutus]